MAVSLREYRAKIKSTQSMKKITRAMELIAASRIVRAQQRVAAARPYSEQITSVIENLAAGGAVENLMAFVMSSLSASANASASFQLKRRSGPEIFTRS